MRLLINGNVHTLDDEIPRANALLIDNGKVVAAGDGDLEDEEPELTDQEGLARRPAAHVSAERSSVALLFYHPSQLGLIHELLDRKRTRGDEVLAVVDTLVRNGPRPCAEQKLSNDGLKSHRQLQNVIKFLVDAGLVVRQSTASGAGAHIARHARPR